MDERLWPHFTPDFYTIELWGTSAIHLISCFSSFFGLQLTFATCPGEKKDKMSPFVLLSSFYSYPFTLKFKSLKLANNHYLKLLNITSFYPWYLVILIMKELNLNSLTYCHNTNYEAQTLLLLETSYTFTTSTLTWRVRHSSLGIHLNYFLSA